MAWQVYAADYPALDLTQHVSHFDALVTGHISIDLLQMEISLPKLCVLVRSKP